MGSGGDLLRVSTQAIVYIERNSDSARKESESERKTQIFAFTLGTVCIANEDNTPGARAMQGLDYQLTSPAPGAVDCHRVV